MRIVAIALAAICGLSLSGIARADDIACNAASNAQATMPIEKAIEKVESLGYAVRKAKRSKGCWEVEGFDRHGAKIEIRLDPASGDVVKPNGWRPAATAK